MSLRTFSRRASGLLLAGVLSVSGVMATGIAAAPAALAQTAATDAVYSGTSPNTTAVDYQGVTRAIYFDVTDKAGQVDQTALATDSGWSNSGMNNASIIDVDQMASINLVITLTNTTGANANITAVYRLPEGNRFQTSAERPELVANGTLNATAGSVTAQFNDADNKTVKIDGTLAAGQSITVTIPMTLANEASLDMSLGPFSAAYAKASEDYITVDGQLQTFAAALYVRFAHRLLGSDGNDILASTQPYLGTVKNTDGTYSTVPADIQALMPAATASDYVTENMQRGVNASQYDGVVSTFMDEGSNDTALYTGSLYYVKTDRIKTALEGSGWSVNNLTHPLIGDSDAISDIYAYQTWGNLTITGANGAAVSANDAQYVELYEYIRARDVSLNVGDTFDPTDALDWIHSYDGQELTLSDPRVSVDVSAVDTSTPGTYPVTYTYTPAGGESVTKTIQVTVLAPTPVPVATATATATATAAATPSAAPSATPTSSVTTVVREPELAHTGANLTGVMALAAASLVFGLILLRRRRA